MAFLSEVPEPHKTVPKAHSKVLVLEASSGQVPGSNAMVTSPWHGP